MYNRIVLGVIVAALFSGCTADLRSGRKFDGFQTPPENKALIYFLRDESIMAAKLPYVYVRQAAQSSNGEPVLPYRLAAVVGQDMFVPVLFDAGQYVIQAGAKDLLTFKSGEVRCIEVGGKFRGITVFVVEEMAKAECENILRTKDEGIQLVEALKRTGQLKEGPLTTVNPAQSSESKPDA